MQVVGATVRKYDCSFWRGCVESLEVDKHLSCGWTSLKSDDGVAKTEPVKTRLTWII